MAMCKSSYPHAIAQSRIRSTTYFYVRGTPTTISVVLPVAGSPQLERISTKPKPDKTKAKEQCAQNHGRPAARVFPIVEIRSARDRVWLQWISPFDFSLLSRNWTRSRDSQIFPTPVRKEVT